MSRRFEDRVALITGAGSGIGRAVALRLAAEGASVFAVDIDATTLEETNTLASGRLMVHVADLAEPEACAGAVAACLERTQRLDVLGNIAGIYVAEHTVTMARAQYRRLMAINLDSYFYLAQEAIPRLLESGGCIVSIASNAGIMGVPYSAAYCASKGGVIALTRSLAVEFLKTSLRINAIAPAGTNTNIAASASFPSDMDPQIGGTHGRIPRPGRTRGGSRVVCLSRFGRGPLHHRRRLQHRQRLDCQLTDRHRAPTGTHFFLAYQVPAIPPPGQM